METYKSFRKLITLWGESDEPWNKSAKSSFFFTYRQTEFNVSDFPVNTYCTTDSLLEMRRIMSSKIESFDKKTDESYAAKIELWIQSYNQDHPFWKYTSGFKLIPKFIFHSGSYYLPIKIGNNCYKAYQFLVKVMQSFLYYYMLIFGLAGLTILALKYKEYLYLGIVICIIVLFCFVAKLIEWRYFLYSYPFLTLGASYFTVQILLNFISGYISTLKSSSKR